MTGLALDANNDLIVGGTQMTRTSDASYLAQKLRSKLQLIQGESDLDPTAGLPYFTEIFVKPVNIPAVVALYKSEILNTEGVNELLTFNYDLDTTSRLFTISFSLNTIYGTINVNNFTINIGG